MLCWQLLESVFTSCVLTVELISHHMARRGRRVQVLSVKEPSVIFHIDIPTVHSFQPNILTAVHLSIASVFWFSFSILFERKRIVHNIRTFSCLHLDCIKCFPQFDRLLNMIALNPGKESFYWLLNCIIYSTVLPIRISKAARKIPPSSTPSPR